jgi:hypothetical protein
MPMRRRDRRPANLQRQVHQLDLFGPPGTTNCDRPVPAWRMLPEETRRAVTGLMARLILEHGRVDRRPARTEAADEV